MEELINLSARIAEEEMAVEGGCYISVRRPKGMVITNDGADLNKLETTDMINVERSDNVSKEFATHLAIYQAYPHVKVIMHLKPLFSLAASRMNITPRASTEMHAEVIGKKIVTTTTIPERVVEMLVKRREILMMNSGLLVLGYDVEECYARAKRIENAIFTYIAGKLLGKRASARKIPCDKIYKNYFLNIDKKEERSNGPALRLNFDKLEWEIVNMDEDNCYIFVTMPKYVALFAHTETNLAGLDTVEYGDLSNNKYRNEVAKLANTKSKVLLRGRGILACDDEQWASDTHTQKVEEDCKNAFYYKVQNEFNTTINGMKDIIRLYADKFNIKIEL